ncbi:MAG TPA: DUF429 domain-containing protein, partial [Lachnospiraceae bacterium]|nr:DUF429 domain-containing protein [Lachnospiraceae bacterium]
FNIETIELEKVAIAAKQYKCNVDDIIDAICLAVTAQMVLIGRYQVIPDNPMEDDTGIIMQMVIPEKCEVSVK